MREVNEFTRGTEFFVEIMQPNRGYFFFGCVFPNDYA